MNRFVSLWSSVFLFSVLSFILYRVDPNVRWNEGTKISLAALGAGAVVFLCWYALARRMDRRPK
ncbi:MAG: hypothetical protein HYV78_00160 [Candidatus Wildermuthbacteria bacterium]|nr:hypothetical protein [Candidatus Wildermuthbacteria bacterium]